MTKRVKKTARKTGPSPRQGRPHSKEPPIKEPGAPSPAIDEPERDPPQEADTLLPGRT